MKRLILVLLINILPSSIFALGGFGLQGGLALSKIEATKTIEGLAILNTAEFSNPYAVGAYFYVDAIPFLDIEIDHIFKAQFYDFGFNNPIEIGPYQFLWGSSSTYMTVRKSILDFNIPFLAETNLLVGGGYNMHTVSPIFTLEMMRKMMGGDLTGDPTNISEDDIKKFLRNNKRNTDGYHLQVGLQFKVFVLDSFLIYRYVISDDLITNQNGVSIVQFRLGYGF